MYDASMRIRSYSLARRVPDGDAPKLKQYRHSSASLKREEVKKMSKKSPSQLRNEAIRNARKVYSEAVKAAKVKRDESIA